MLTDPDLIEKLESKISYLEYNLENLSNEVYELRQIIEKQKIQINFLAGKLKSVEVSNIAPRSEETPPPHYYRLLVSEYTSVSRQFIQVT